MKYSWHWLFFIKLIFSSSPPSTYPKWKPLFIRAIRAVGRQRDFVFMADQCLFMTLRLYKASISLHSFNGKISHSGFPQKQWTNKLGGQISGFELVFNLFVGYGAETSNRAMKGLYSMNYLLCVSTTGGLGRLRILGNLIAVAHLEQNKNKTKMVFKFSPENIPHYFVSFPLPHFILFHFYPTVPTGNPGFHTLSYFILTSWHHYEVH